MNSDTAASAVSLLIAAWVTVGVRTRFPFEAQAADPPLAPSNLRKSLLSNAEMPPLAGHCPSRYHWSAWSPQRPGLTKPKLRLVPRPPSLGGRAHYLSRPVGKLALCLLQ